MPIESSGKETQAEKGPRQSGSQRMIPSRFRTMREVLLICGVLSSLLFAAIVIIVPMQWDAYDSAARTISELSAIGAPTRTLWMVLYTPYALLMVAFGLGVRKSAVGNRLLRIAGSLLMVYGALCFLKIFAPMHLRETLAAGGETLSDRMHIALSVITQIIYVLSVLLVATALGKPFRLYSIITIMIILVFGGMTFWDGLNIAKNLPTPLTGVWQRINFGIFLLWVVVLAVVLLKNKKIPASLVINRRPEK